MRKGVFCSKQAGCSCQTAVYTTAQAPNLHWSYRGDDEAIKALAWTYTTEQFILQVVLWAAENVLSGGELTVDFNAAPQPLELANKPPATPEPRLVPLVVSSYSYECRHSLHPLMVTIRSHFGTGIQKSSVGIFWDQDHDSNACFMKPDGAIVRNPTAGASGTHHRRSLIPQLDGLWHFVGFSCLKAQSEPIDGDYSQSFRNSESRKVVFYIWDQDHDSNACFMKPNGANVRNRTAGARRMDAMLGAGPAVASTISRPGERHYGDREIGGQTNGGGPFLLVLRANESAQALRGRVVEESLQELRVFDQRNSLQHLDQGMAMYLE
eukprot:symbB.v1.2.003931.t1/scaffold210.1/size302740/22